MEVGLLELRLAHSYIDVVLGRFLLRTCQQVVDVAGRAAVDLVLLGHVAGVAR